MSVLFEKTEIKGMELKNKLVRSATYEGMADDNGFPTENLFELYIYHFYVHKQKQCVLFIEDDYARFIAGWAMAPTEKVEPVIESFDLAVQRYGRPDGVMTDRGSAFHSWKGLSRFEALLEDYEINYYLAK
ncbi:MAG: hypothetical protein GY850_14875, partial [bacterium]|nr:hypothetical protein [bacterium]